MNSENKMKIREATIDDAAGLARVHVDTWRTAYAGIVPDEHLAKLSYEQRTQRWREMFAAPYPGRLMLAAENEQGQVVGFAIGGPERESDPVYKGELYGLYLLKEYQKRGIGRKLVTTIAQFLLKSGFTNMLIWVLAENPACDFYEALGGRPVRGKSVVIGGKKLRELGYGWDDIRDFAK